MSIVAAWTAVDITHHMQLILTSIPCGSGCCLWKCDQRSGGGSSSRLHTRVVDCAVLVLHAGGVSGGWGCCLRHADEGIAVWAAAGRAEGVCLTRVSICHCAACLSRNQHMLSGHRNTRARIACICSITYAIGLSGVNRTLMFVFNIFCSERGGGEWTPCRVAVFPRLCRSLPTPVARVEGRHSQSMCVKGS